MNFLNGRMHGIVDYAVVIVFALAPSLFALSGPTAYLCYTLAAAHLAMTALTDMPLGIVKALPFNVHGTIEMIVGLASVATAWTIPHLLPGGQTFFTVMGSAIFLLWVISKYGTEVPASAE